MISDIEDNKITKIDLFMAMRLLDNAWKSVTQNTIKNCFRKAFFEFGTPLTTTLDITDEDITDDIWKHLSEITSTEYSSFEEYVRCDDVNYIDNFRTDDEIVQTINSHSQELIELNTEEAEEGEIEDEDSDVNDVISQSQAFNSLNTLQKYFCQIGNNDKNDLFNELQNELTINTFNTLKQSKITDFFKQ